MNILGSHLTWIVVKNLDDGIRFYTECVGLKLLERDEKFAWAELGASSGSRIGLAEYAPTNEEMDGISIPAGSNGVITLSVKNLEEAVEEYRKKGGTLLGKVVEIPDIVKMHMCRDPDGNLFQLVQML